ncbi:RNA polymerase ECF-type sigma factor [Arcticibacter svalbardensis MN12-7]|uniref:RNA polymerase ECF-type sigma factor n=1 Tax=Arcticibacter svalbardensis MN12-7 TaxID=1150600 RepID=R9GR80_9SPHI|nr:RNA polymerase sigma-70 factor [Arcticibacter svalbardensis]EOR94211.1 RNA polymerase ECF-type sigma factor [Arcticibacter svalbardensis MN12-7]
MSTTCSQTFLDLIILRKDDEAYVFLHSQYHHLLTTFAKGYLRYKEPSEEIVNDVLFKVWSKKGKVSEIDNLRLYLFSSVRNECLTQLAKHQREKNFNINLKFNECSLDDPESIFISSELGIKIKETINDLPPRCKQIYELIKIDGKRNKDVAELLGISINTIDAQLAIALKRLLSTVEIFKETGIYKRIK